MTNFHSLVSCVSSSKVFRLWYLAPSLSSLPQQNKTLSIPGTGMLLTESCSGELLALCWVVSWLWFGPSWSAPYLRELTAVHALYQQRWVHTIQHAVPSLGSRQPSHQPDQTATSSEGGPPNSYQIYYMKPPQIVDLWPCTHPGYTCSQSYRLRLVSLP
jgi:hypothetical protein